MTQRAADVERSQAAFEAAKSEVDALTAADWQKHSADTSAAIEKSRSDLNKAIEDQNSVTAELLKLQTRLARLSITTQ